MRQEWVLNWSVILLCDMWVDAEIQVWLAWPATREYHDNLGRTQLWLVDHLSHSLRHSEGNAMYQFHAVMVAQN